MIRTFALMLGCGDAESIDDNPHRAYGNRSRAHVLPPAQIAGMIINIAVAEYWITLTRTPGSGHRHWKDLDRKSAT